MVPGEIRDSMPRRSWMSGTAIGLLFTVGLAPLPAAAQSLPSGGHVTHGDAVITTSGPNLTVTQTSPNAILSWQSFSVGSGASAHFENGAGATLNRVTGNLPSAIDGALTATGSLYLVNPAGVAVGTGGMVRTGGSFVASTHDMSDADFLDGGALTLKGGSKAEVVNRGFVTSLSGDVVLTARRVENSGAIEAPEGSVGLLGGYEVELRDTSLADGKFAVRVGGDDTQVVNTGTVRALEVEMRANGGSVEALAGNTKAIVKATGVKKAGGRIFLTAGKGGTVKATQKMVARRAVKPARRAEVAALPDFGPLPASRPDYSGGEVHVIGGDVTLGGTIDAAGSGAAGGAIVAVADHDLTLTDGATLDASGTDGGLVLVGGDYQGGADTLNNYWDAAIGTAHSTTVAAGAVIAANGATGGGGKVVVWGDGHTSFAGTISATGVTRGGDAEVSGKAVLDFTGTADLTASSGGFGTLLLDPYNIAIVAGTEGTVTGGVFTAEAGASVLGAGTLLAALDAANVTVSTGLAGSPGTQAGDITVDVDLGWYTDATLTLQAAGGITLNKAITARAGGLTLDAGGAIGTGASGTVEVARFTLQNGAWEQNTATLPAFATGDFRIEGGSFLRAAGGDGTAGNPWLLTDIYGVQGMSTHLAGHFALAGDIDASGTQYWWDGAGFVPVGGDTGPSFTGSLDGKGNVISGLSIDRPGDDDVGLFGVADDATISNIGLEGVAVTGRSWVGGLVGRQFFTPVMRAWVSGTVKGKNSVGGLVGEQRFQASVDQSWVSGLVTGTTDVGGLVGYQDHSKISQAWASGTVNGSINIGGLLGGQYSSTVTQSWASSTVNGTKNVGGLLGHQDYGTLTQSWASGAVNGTDNIGGLVGELRAGAIDQVWASGTVTDTNTDEGSVGGLVGRLEEGGGITTSFWDKETTGQLHSAGSDDSFGLTSADARSQTHYLDAGWDFTNDWYQAGDMRPVGRWAAASPDANGDIPVSNLVQLQLMGADLDASYVLTRDIDASATAGTADSPGIWGVGGFVPVGRTILARFAGTLDGRDHVISGLTINQPEQNSVGLFGYASDATISNIGLDGISITGQNDVGGLIARMDGGSVTQAWASGAVTGVSTGSVGGLVGYQFGSSIISQSWASGTITGGRDVGGLVGSQSSASITQAWASGTVTGRNFVGGLVGYQGDVSSIGQSWASSTITGGDDVGGLVGSQSSSSITQSWASGMVTGENNIGGLVGSQFSVSSISQSWASGAVTGIDGFVSIGGLVGWQASGSLNEVWASGAVTGGSSVGSGGLVGWLYSGSISHAWASGKVTAESEAGGLVGRLDSDGSVADSFWDKNATGRNDGMGSGSGAFNATGLTTMEARSQTPYLDAGWDFTADWYQEGDLRPIGRWAAASPDADGNIPVSNSIQLQLIGADLDADYVLTGDIDASTTGANATNPSGIWGDRGFLPLGRAPDAAFTGTFDGGNHLITDLYIDRLNEDFVGLFGYGNGATVRNVGLSDNSVTGKGSVGGLMGVLLDSAISRVWSYGRTTGSENAIGGLVGVQLGGTIGQSWSTGTVNGSDYVGGLVGAQWGGLIEQGAWTSGAVTGADQVGGLVGLQQSGTINQVWATGTVSGTGQVGGLVGAQSSDGSIDQAWVGGTVSGPGQTGGLVGDSDGAITASFWDRTTTGQDLSSGSSDHFGLTTSEFHNTSTFIALAGFEGWDFRTVWVPPSASQYPQLRELQVLSRAVTVEVSAQRLYGDDNSDLVMAYYGLLPGDFLTERATLSGADAATDAGTHTVTATGGAATDPIYRFFHLPGTLTITPRPLMVTGTLFKRIYGDANPTATTAFTAPTGSAGSGSGLVNGDTIESVTVASATADETSNVGSYAFTPGSAVFNTGDAGNYTITYADGTLEVTPRPITVSADDLMRLYGEANPPPGFGAIGGDGLASFHADLAAAGFGLETTATAASDIGDYAITLTGANANYSVTFNPGTLTVNARPITVTADDIAKLLGQADPALSWTVSSGSLASFDTTVGVFTGTLARQAGELPGAYTIGQGTLEANDNYALTFVGGVLTIEPAAVTQSQVLERSADGRRSFVAAPQEDGETLTECAEGVLGPVCAPFVNPDNRDLGPYISWQAP